MQINPKNINNWAVSVKILIQVKFKKRKKFILPTILYLHYNTFGTDNQI